MIAQICSYKSQALKTSRGAELLSPMSLAVMKQIKTSTSYVSSSASQRQAVHDADMPKAEARAHRQHVFSLQKSFLRAKSQRNPRNRLKVRRYSCLPANMGPSRTEKVSVWWHRHARWGATEYFFSSFLPLVLRAVIKM